MNDYILQLLKNGNNIEEIAEELYEDKCIAVEFTEHLPLNCYTLGDCFQCWKEKIIKISDELNKN